MLIRKATYFTPDILLEHNSLCISGKLWMENPSKYFEKIFEKTEKSSASSFFITLNIEHLNSSSIKQLLEYFKFLKKLKDKKKFKQVSVIWIIPDYDTELNELINDLINISELSIDIRKTETINSSDL